MLHVISVKTENTKRENYSRNKHAEHFRENVILWVAFLLNTN